MNDRDDRELLEAAAKAAGYEPVRLTDDGTAMLLHGVQDPWNPLTDNSDALRLAVTLRLDVTWTRDVRDRVVAMLPGNVAWGENSASDPIAATRRAIVRAAAEVGRSMP